MSSLVILGTAIALVVAVGKAADSLMHNKTTKPKVYDRLQAWWEKVDEMEVPNLPRAVAQRTLNLKAWAFGDSLWTVRGVTVTVLLSVLVTTAATLVGGLLEYYESGWTWEDVVFHATHNDLLTIRSPWYAAMVYSINLGFDGLTVAVTFYVLAWVARSRPLVATVLLVFDGFAALVLAAACAAALGIGDWAYFESKSSPYPV